MIFNPHPFMGWGWQGEKMSVPVSKRGETGLEADHHLHALRDEITDFILLDFGYSKEKNNEKIERFRKSHEYSEHCDAIVARRKKKAESFEEWFIDREADALLEMMRKIQVGYTIGNSIYPSDTPAKVMEYRERRRHMNEAISTCYALMQEIQYIGRILPVDLNRFETITESILKQIALIKGIRKADNRFIRNK